MALSVDYLYKFALDVMKKSQAGGLSSTSFAYHWNNEQSNYMTALLGPFQLKSNDPQNPKVGLLQNKTNLGKLAQLATSASLTVVSGLAAKPSDYIFSLNLYTNGYEILPMVLNQVQIISRSVIDPPEAAGNKYYFAENTDEFEFLPTSIPTTVTLKYVRTPTDVLWGYTFDGDNRQVYDAGSSVQPVWDDLSCREITMRMFKTLGVSYKDGDFYNFGQSVKSSGQ